MSGLIGEVINHNAGSATPPTNAGGNGSAAPGDIAELSTSIGKIGDSIGKVTSKLTELGAKDSELDGIVKAVKSDLEKTTQEINVVKNNVGELSEQIRKTVASMSHSGGRNSQMDEPWSYSMADGSRQVIRFSSRRYAEELAHLIIGFCAIDEKVRNRVRSIADKKYPIAAHALSSNDKDGMSLWIPEEFQTDLIRNVETVGHFERYAERRPMSSSQLTLPKDGNELTVYYPEDGDAVTESEPTGETITCTARRYATLTKINEEVVDDVALDMLGYMMEKIIYAFGRAVDTNGFRGTGLKTQARVVGAFGHADVTTHILGNVIGASATNTTKTAFSNLTLADLANAQGLLPTVSRANARWFAHRYITAIVRGMVDDAGNGIMQTFVNSGVGEVKTVLGDPWIEVDVMPSTSAVTTDFILYGDLQRAYLLGRRQGFMVERTKDAAFANFQLWMRASRRLGIVCKDGTQLVKIRTSTT